MSDELEILLRLVAEGRLTAEEAAPIVAALGARPGADAREPANGPRSGERADTQREEAGGRARANLVEQALSGRHLGIHIAERGRSVVDLRIPLGAAGFAIDRVPGLSEDHRSRIVEAIQKGTTGPILEVHEEGDEVRIVIE